MGLSRIGADKRCYRLTRDSKHGLPVAANLFARNLTAAVPNQVWAADITYLRTDESWPYLSQLAFVSLILRSIRGSIGWRLKLPNCLTLAELTTGVTELGPRVAIHYSLSGLAPTKS